MTAGYTVSQVAGALGVSRRAIQHEVDEGLLPAKFANGEHRISEDGLTKYLLEDREQARAVIAAITEKPEPQRHTMSGAPAGMVAIYGDESTESIDQRILETAGQLGKRDDASGLASLYCRPDEILKREIDDLESKRPEPFAQEIVRLREMRVAISEPEGGRALRREINKPADEPEVAVA